MRYGIYTIQTRGNGFTALVTRDDGAEVFFQGEESTDFLDEVARYEAADIDPADYIDNYFLEGGE